MSSSSNSTGDISSDLDLAFNLQLQEALTLSLQSNDVVTTQLQSDEISKLEQELNDTLISQSEFRKSKHDLQLRLHDHSVALEISNMDDDEWEDWGDEFERPFGEGTSEPENEAFRVYFKGLVEKDGDGVALGGIGVAVCDPRGELLFEVRKPVVLSGGNRQVAEFLALVEGLNAALCLDLNRVVFYCDSATTFNFIIGRWSSKQKKVASLVNKVSQLREKFVSCSPDLVPRNNIKFAFKLAKEAIVSQLNKPAESSSSRIHYETCVICLEDQEVSQIFTIDKCMHRYCHSCMKQHVEVKLLHGLLPACPHEGCKDLLRVDSCSRFLTPRLVEIMTQRIKEASMSFTDKVYCPYPKCSALMSKKDVLEHSKRSIYKPEVSGARNCMKCNCQFCVNCKVPWHVNMTCLGYKKIHPFPPIEETRLKNLAASNLWRQCVKCNIMIELAAGCYHMTCRCGYEFCYTCGAEWRKKKATCSCPLWDEENILEEETDEDEEEEYYDSEEDEEEEDSESDDDYY